MRFAYPLAVLGIVLNAASPMAQDPRPADRPAASEWTGPIVGGRHRQPTPAEIEARQRAAGQSAKAIEERRRKEDKTIDDLYKQLVTPAPSSERSGEQGQPAR
jgi:hypothetical protein